MGRSARENYLVQVRYGIGWGDNDTTACSGWIVSNRQEAFDLAYGHVARMRRAGAASAIRQVTVKRWDDRTSLTGRPQMFHASYYDPEQGLTEAEAYAARVHQWHELPDRCNATAGRHGSSVLMGYGTWLEDWGPTPTTCPACAAPVDQQDFGTARRLGYRIGDLTATAAAIDPGSR